MYRGESDRYIELISRYAGNALAATKEIPQAVDSLTKKLESVFTNLKQYAVDSKPKRKAEEQKKLDESSFGKKLVDFELEDIASSKLEWKKDLPATNKEQHVFAAKLNVYAKALKETGAMLKKSKDQLIELFNEADRLLKIKNDKAWIDLELNNVLRVLDQLQENLKTTIDQVNYWYGNIDWLQSHFPDGKYNDVVGLCKVASKKEYVEDQEYSLNAGRYVGVKIEDDELNQSEFEEKLLKQYAALEELSKSSELLEIRIKENINALISL